MKVVPVCGVDGTTAVVLELPHLVTGPIDARTEARGGLAGGGVFAQLTLRIQQLPLVWYSRQKHRRT